MRFGGSRQNGEGVRDRAEVLQDAKENVVKIEGIR